MNKIFTKLKLIKMYFDYDQKEQYNIISNHDKIYIHLLWSCLDLKFHGCTLQLYLQVIILAVDKESRLIIVSIIAKFCNILHFMIK